MAEYAGAARPEPMTPNEVRELVQMMVNEKQFTARNREYGRMRALLRQERQVVIPGIKNLQLEYRTPKVENDASDYRDRLISAPMSLDVAAQGPGPKAAEKAQRLKNLGKRTFDRWMQQAVFDKPLHDMSALGRGHVLMFLNREILPLPPSPQEGEDPEAYLKRAGTTLEEFRKGERGDLVMAEPVSPETVYWTSDRAVKMIASRVQLNPLARLHGRDGSGGYWPSRAINWNGKTPVVTTLRDGVATDTSTAPWNAEAWFYLVADGDYCYHMLGASLPGTDIEPVGCYLNVFGRPPIFDIDGRRTGEPDALWSARPLIAGLYQLAPIENVMGTIIAAGAVTATQEQKTLEPAPGQEAVEERADNRENMQVRLLNGQFILPPFGWRITETGIELPDTVLKAREMVRGEMDEYGYPRVLGRPEEISASSGYDRAKAQDAVTSKLDPPLQHWADCITEMLAAQFTSIKTLGEPMTVRNLNDTPELGAMPIQVQEEITVNPDDVVDVDISVSFDSVTTYTRLALEEQGIGQMSAGVMHKDEYLREVRGVQDVRRWRDDKAISDMYDFADLKAVEAAQAAFTAIQQFAMAESQQKAGLKEPSASVSQQVLGQQPGDQGGGGGGGPTYPTGGGGGRAPIEPTPDPAAELGMTGAGEVM